jgi:DNA polymerase-3 subunit delta
MNTQEETQSQKPLLPLYAIISEQSFLREQAVDRLKKRLEQEGEFEFNYDSFDASNAEGDSITAAANTLPFASQYRLIIVNNIHQAKKELLDALALYAQSPSPTTVLAVVGEKLAKSSKLYKAIVKSGAIVERTKPKRKDLPPIVQSLFSAQGKQVSFELASDIIASVGEEIEALNTAIIKTATYMGDRSRVSREDIDAVIELSAEIKVWDLTDAIMMRDAKAALSVFDLLLKQDNSIYVVHPAVARTLRELIVARACIDKDDGTVYSVASALGKPDWMARRTLEGAHRFYSEELRQGLSRLAGVEYKLKTSSVGEAAYRRWILEFCSEALRGQ